MSTLKERLQELMATMGWEYPDLVAASGMSRSVVSQWLGRGSKTIHTIGRLDAAERLEAASGYAALWLATGQGPKFAQPASAATDQHHAGAVLVGRGATAPSEATDRRDPSWPFRQITPQQWAALDEFARGAAEYATLQAIERCASGVQRKRTGTA